MFDRPLDLLNSIKGKRVLVHCKEDKVYSGKFIAFDIHINIALEDTKEIINGEEATFLGLTFFRGDTVKFVSPRD